MCTCFSCSSYNNNSNIYIRYSSVSTKHLLDFNIFRTQNSLLALLLLPLGLAVKKSLKKDDQIKLFSKSDVQRSFLLVVEDPVNLSTERSNQEDWLKSNDLTSILLLFYAEKSVP
ncbi:uncharacterized protein LOC127287536 isoform X2 [Leptopilina boulardi]|uniref:uncharacterized protein LOC127287536 isoform X2 n=1 Tax=Leptopilina boulardi TaxID=63433 RepID=UPI0021F51D52|nr:uncharacterized protein LOC127287536 isoform X2 [Leptopilina boulardi]